jgi:hypothetical protein
VLAPFDPDPHRAFIIASTQTGDQVPEVAQRVRSHIAAALPEAEGRVKLMWTTGPEPRFLEIRIYGPDAWPLYAKGVEFTDRVRAIPGTIDIRNNWENTVIKAPVLIDQARAPAKAIRRFPSCCSPYRKNALKAVTFTTCASMPPE